MKLDPKAFGIACGLLWGGGLFLATLYVSFMGGGEHLDLLARFYFFYTVTPLGAVIGFVWGFIDGCIGGFLLAWIYNKIAKT